MAGISLTYSKNETDSGLYSVAQKLTSYHKFSDKEAILYKKGSDKIGYGVVSLPRADAQAKYYSGLKFECLVEGKVFIQKETKAFLENKYSLNFPEEEYLLPYLWNEYREESWRYILGWFNWMIIDPGTHEVMLINDRFGMIPCYYMDSDRYFAIASKFTSFLAAGILDKKVDPAVLLQLIAFAYPVVDRAVIRDVNIVPSASILKISNNRLTLHKYWNVEEFLHRKNNTMSKKDSVPFIFYALQSVVDRLSSGIDYFTISLTGGWDGRVVLSFLDSVKKNHFFLYSFGTGANEDIRIPRQLAKDLGYDYLPVLLDDNYLNAFPGNALDTLFYSDGLRSVSRTQYLYSSNILGQKTRTLFSGNCGSNILKSISKPSALYNSNVLRLFMTDHLPDEASLIFDELMNKGFLKKASFNKEEFVESLKGIDIPDDPGMDKARKFYHFLLSVIERRYFGVEMASYAHNINNYSPFIDFEFVDAITKTPFFGGFSDFRSPGKFKILEVSRLYSRLIGMNSEKLAKYPTNRGFALADLDSLAGLFPAAIKYFKERKLKRPPDNYNFSNAIQILNNRFPLMNSEFLDSDEISRQIIKGNIPEALISAYSWGLWDEQLSNRLKERYYEGIVR